MLDPRVEEHTETRQETVLELVDKSRPKSAGGFRSAVTGLPKMPPLASVGSAMSRMRTRSPPRFRCSRAASAANDSGPELMRIPTSAAREGQTSRPSSKSPCSDRAARGGQT